MVYDLLELALSDNHYDDSERRMIKTFGLKLKLPRSIIKELVESMVQNIKNGNDFGETLKRVDFLVVNQINVGRSPIIHTI